MENNQDLKNLSDKFIAYLRTELGNPAIEFASPLERLRGGYETATYRFKLKHAPDELSKQLVLRLYPQFYGTRNAIWERAIQNVLKEKGFPVAQAYMVCSDLSILGGAFFIMDYLQGQILAAAPLESVPDLLGKTHAELHKIDPSALIEELENLGIPEDDYKLSSRLAWLDTRAEKMPWVRQAVNWLLENCPSEPKRLAVCHGDFHPFNILYADGRVTGVLDWPGFAIADPVFDIANSIVIITISAKHLASSMGNFSTVDWDLMANQYLAAYRAHGALDQTNLSYYQARRCVLALIQGVDGQKVWQHPLIVRDMITYVHEVTGIQITMPV
jgi:aminoglycoside phosphotransferase (APT) family kinase protein